MAAIVLTGRFGPCAGAGGRGPDAGQDRRRPPLPARRLVKACLVVNPSAGGGRAGRALPRRPGRARPSRYRAQGAANPQSRARRRAGGRGNGRRRDNSDPWWRRADQRRRGRAASTPAAFSACSREAAATTSRACWGSRSDPVAACAVLAANVVRELDLGEWSTTGRSSASRAADLTPTPIGSRTRPGSCAATSCTHTARCARWPAGVRPASR